MLINFHEAIHLDYSEESGPSALLENTHTQNRHFRVTTESDH